MASGPSPLWSRFADHHARDLATPYSGPISAALVVGVSAYPGLKGRSAWNMKGLNSAAGSALEFAEWLITEFTPPKSTPLRSVRVLLSPTDEEANRVGTDRLGDAPRAEVANVQDALDAWVADCRKAPGGTAILYFAGHGVFESQFGSSLLLQDLDDGLKSGPNLAASLDLAPIQKGLGHIGVTTSWTFVDACQAKLREHAHFGRRGIQFSYVEKPKDQRVGRFSFSAAAEGTLAYGEVGGTSVFVRALLQALRHEAVERDLSGAWIVDSVGLARHLCALKSYEDQEFQPDLVGVPQVFQTFDEPQGHVVVSLSPANEAPDFDVSIVDGGGVLPGRPQGPLSPHPLDVSVSPGVWVVRLHSRRGRPCRPELLAPEVRPFRTATTEFET